MIPFPRRRSHEIHPDDLEEETPCRVVRDDWMELSLSDCEVVRGDCDSTMRRREPTDPGVSFTRILTAEIDRALEAQPRTSKHTPLRMLSFVEVPEPVPMPRTTSRATVPTLRLPARTPKGVPWSQRSRIPLATAVLTCAIVGGLLADQIRAGRFDAVVQMATSLVVR